MAKQDTTKFSITVPVVVAEALQQWANEERRTRGNLAALVLEMAVRLRYEGKFGPSPSEVVKATGEPPAIDIGNLPTIQDPSYYENMEGITRGQE